MKDPKLCQFCNLPTYGEWHSCCNAQAVRIRELETALREIAKCKFCGQTHAQRVAHEALKGSVPETGAKPVQRTNVCKHYATVENCPLCSPKSEGGKDAS